MADKRIDRFYVYLLRIEDEPLPFYVGKGSGKRAKSHICECNLNTETNKHKTNKIKKALRGNKKVLVEYIESDLIEQKAFDLEIASIIKYGRRDLKTGCLTNMSNGGEGLSGYVHSKDQILNNSKRNLGRKHSLETRKLMSDARIGRKHPQSFFDKMNGKIVSDDTKRKMSLSAIEANKSEEVLNRKRNAALNRTSASVETREKMSKVRSDKVPFIHINTNERIWLSPSDMAPKNYYSLPPWKTGKQSAQTVDIWKQSNILFGWWNETEKGYVSMSKKFSIPQRRVLQNMITKFKEGWIPQEDPLWLLLKERK